MAAPRKQRGFVKFSKFELDRREERRQMIIAARANGVEHVVRDGRTYTVIYLPTEPRR